MTRSNGAARGRGAPAVVAVLLALGLASCADAGSVADAPPGTEGTIAPGTTVRTAVERPGTSTTTVTTLAPTSTTTSAAPPTTPPPPPAPPTTVATAPAPTWPPADGTIYEDPPQLEPRTTPPLDGVELPDSGEDVSTPLDFDVPIISVPAR